MISRLALSITIVLISIHSHALAQKNEYVERLDSSLIASSKVNEMVDEMLNSMQEGVFFELSSNEAMPEFRKQFTHEHQKSFYQNNMVPLGNYLGQAELVEAYRVVKENVDPFELYRVKVSFLRDGHKRKLAMEMRMIYYENDDRLVNFFFMPWTDSVVGIQQLMN